MNDINCQACVKNEQKSIVVTERRLLLSVWMRLIYVG